MTNNNRALMVMDFDTLQRMSMALYKSGYFQDVKSEAQAIVKVMAGAELGIPPFASMAGINVIQGKPALGANLIATLVKNDPRYDYKIDTCTNQECYITWYEQGKATGQSSFTFKEAQSIEQWNSKKNAFEPLTNKHNWKNYPSDMLFARAITRGARRFAPGIFGGAPVYTPEELGADVDPDGYIEGEVITLEPELDVWELDRAAQEEIAEKEALAQEYAHGLGADYEEDPEPEPEFDEGKIADSRAWLENKVKDGKVMLGFVGDALAMTDLYSGREHVENWLNGDFEDAKALREAGLVIDMRKYVTEKGGLKVFDAGIARKQEEGGE